MVNNMAELIERPILLTPSIGEVFGNEKSRKLVVSAFDEGYKFYCDFINDDDFQYYTNADALRGAASVVIGSLESKVHQLSIEVEDHE